MRLDHYSYSSYRLFTECPRRFLDYVTGQAEKKETPALKYGSKFHDEVEKYHRGEPYDNIFIKVYTDKVPQNFYSDVESDFRVTLKHPINKRRKIEVPFVGRIDGINHEGLFDLKTLTNPPDMSYFSDSDQATLYLYQHWLKTKELLPFHFIVYLKGTKDIKIYRTSRTVEDFEELFERLYLFNNMVRENQFPCWCGKCQI